MIRTASLKSVAYLLLAFPLYAHSFATYKAEVAPRSAVLVADGIIEAVRMTEISPPTSGRITHLFVRAGDKVKAGQAVARIDGRIAEHQLESGKAQASAVNEQLNDARKSLERQKQLFSQGFISSRAMEKADADYRSVSATARAQEAMVSAAIVQNKLYSIVAPYAGVVSELNIEVGGLAVPGKTMMVMFDPSDMRATVNVSQSRVNELKLDADSRVVVEKSRQKWSVSGAQVIVLPQADPKTQDIAVRLPLPADVAGLFPGGFVRAHFPLRGSGESFAVRIPLNAILKRNELSMVYVLGAQNRPELRLVRLGKIVNGMVDVLSGLDPGERVVTDPLAVQSRQGN